MKAKLVKRSNDRFDLYSIEDKNQINTIASSFDNPNGKLSLKNCQAIERGYDLEELACKEIRIDISVVKHIDAKRKENSSPCIPLNEGGCVGSNLYNQVKGFEKGFQKALEILGDKKFTENNIDEAFDAGYEMLDSPKNYNDTLKEFKESLEPTEWDVSFNPDVKDENSCLILVKV